jgi:hypothetical protein
MIKLLALVYILVGGVEGPAPVKTYYYKNTFETIAICEEARASDEVKNGVAELEQFLRDNNPGIDLVVKTKCVDEEEED